MTVALTRRSPASAERRRVDDRGPRPRQVLAGDWLYTQDKKRVDLLETIESEIIPRLMLAHRAEPQARSRCAQCRQPPTESELLEFARIATCHDLSGALAFVAALCREGLSLEMILIDLIGCTARLLGDQWNADVRTFNEVSAGLGTLQQVVHILSPSFAPTLAHRGLVVLVAAPGEQHTLGLYMVGEFLRRAGWGVHVDPCLPPEELFHLVATERVEMVGITVSSDELLEPLGGLIAAVRQASRNQSLSVMLGGSLDLGEYAALHGVSLCTADPREAVRWLDSRVPSHCKS